MISTRKLNMDSNNLLRYAPTIILPLISFLEARNSSFSLYLDWYAYSLNHKLPRLHIRMEHNHLTTRRYLGSLGVWTISTKNSSGKSHLRVKKIFNSHSNLGLYEVDVGLKPPTEGGETGNNLMVFADLNSDKYTDIISVSDSKATFTVHLYDPFKKMFAY